MASNINPTLEPTKSLDKFRFWCQKVLPLVYDDSLSYYEVLGKMVVQLNDVIDNINADTENVLTLKEAFDDLKDYVDNFFDDIEHLAEYAERAEAAQTAANRSAINAASSAVNASISSQAAMDARASAQTAAQDATASKNDAITAATTATTKASEAAQSAINAQTAQAGASQSATLADAARSAAQTAAQTATDEADEASASASAAATSEQNVETLVEGLPSDFTELVDVNNNSPILPSELTNYLLNHNYDDLMDMTTPSATNVRSIQLMKNKIITKVTASSPTGSTYYAFLISKTPRLVAATSSPWNNLTAEDFTDLNIVEANNIILNLSYKGQTHGTHAAAGQIIICSYNNETGVISRVSLGGFGSLIKNTPRFINYTNNISAILPSIITDNNICILYLTRYPDIEEEYTISIGAEYLYDDKIAPSNGESTAKVAYDVNDFILQRGELYRVIAPIARNETLIIGTNIVKTTVGEQLTYLLNRQ